MRRRQAILNADDFGFSPQVNAAVAQAAEAGILTSASVMVGGEAWREAIEIARRHPTLAIGLHVVLVAGRPVLPAEALPHLVQSDGRFPDDPLRQGLRLAFSAAAREEADRELAAQFERFAASGLALAHVDGHLHFHLHPAVLERLLPLAERYGACGVRVPHDELGLALVHDRKRLAGKLRDALALGLAARYAARRLGGTSLASTERTYGLLQSGCMEESYVLALLQRRLPRTFELYFHPSTDESGEALGPNPRDLATLLSPRVREALAHAGVERTDYRGLHRSVP